MGAQPEELRAGVTWIDIGRQRAPDAGLAFVEPIAVAILADPRSDTVKHPAPGQLPLVPVWERRFPNPLVRASSGSYPKLRPQPPEPVVADEERRCSESRWCWTKLGLFRTFLFSAAPQGACARVAPLLRVYPAGRRIPSLVSRNWLKAWRKKAGGGR